MTVMISSSNKHHLLYMNEGFSSCFSICNIVFYLLQDLDYLERQAFNRFSCLHQVLKKMFISVIYIYLKSVSVSVQKCDEEYIGQSSRTFGERFKEHLKPPSPIYYQSNISGHNVSINNFKIVGREDLNQMRAIKEAIYIRVNDPSLNRNVGKYHLPHVCDEVLANISELKLK